MCTFVMLDDNGFFSFYLAVDVKLPTLMLY